MARIKRSRSTMATQHYSRLDEDLKPRSSTSPFKIVIFVAFLICSMLFMMSLLNPDEVLPPAGTSKIFQEFYNCAYPKLRHLKGDIEGFWTNFVNLTKPCDGLEAFQSFDIRPVENTDEVKYVAFPRKNENITMVTVGVGHDVDAEIKLKEIYPQTEFYGVDPIPEINKDLYEKKLGGSFFPIALSGSGGMFKSHVFRNHYGNEIIMHIGANYFFGEMLKKPKIDVLWIDNEGHEYTILELLHKGGKLDQSGIKICQMNVEMHKNSFEESHDEKQKFHDFVWKVLEDGKYVMLKPYFVTRLNKGFIRTFIINVADKECTDLYVN